MTSERLVFANSIEGLFIRGVGPQLTPEIRTELRKVGIDVEKPLLPAYPSQTYQRAIDVLVTHLHPKLSVGEAQFKLGERAVFGVTDTFVGRSGIAFAKLIGTKRSLMRFPVSSMSSTNFAKMEAREVGPQSIEIVTCPIDGHIEFLKGCVSAVVVLTGGKDPTFDVTDHDVKAERAVLRVSWKS